MRIMRQFGVLGLLVACAAGPANGQAAFSTFGPGDSFDGAMAALGQQAISGDHIDVASPFTYALGTPHRLDFFRVAIFTFDQTFPMTARLLAGADINTAVELEAISRTVEPPGQSSAIFTFQSALRPVLTPGMIYWLALSVDAPTTLVGWHLNDQGWQGRATRVDGGSWTTSPQADAPAFDVVVDRTARVVPEPLSAVLLGTGLLGLAAAIRRNRRGAVRHG